MHWVEEASRYRPQFTLQRNNFKETSPAERSPQQLHSTLDVAAAHLPDRIPTLQLNLGVLLRIGFWRLAFGICNGCSI